MWLDVVKVEGVAAPCAARPAFQNSTALYYMLSAVISDLHADTRARVLLILSCIMLVAKSRLYASLGASWVVPE